MGNTCQQQGQNQKIFDQENTVESQDYNATKRVKNNGDSAAKATSNNHSGIHDKHHHNPHAKSSSSSTAANNVSTTNKSKEQSYTQSDFPYTFIRRPAPFFTGTSYLNGFRNITLKDYKGQYVVLFFFPVELSETCRKEIIAFSDMNDKFTKANCQVIGCSQDSQFAHMNYCKSKRTEGGLGPLEFPLLADVDKQISTSYGVIVDAGTDSAQNATLRSTFIIDSNQMLRHMSINDAAISVNPEEILRLILTFQQSDRDNPGKSAASGCPFAAHAKEMASNQDIDTFSRYQRKKSEKAGSSESQLPQQHAKSTHGATKSMQAGQTKEADTIFSRLGGAEVVQSITDKFVACIFSDPLLKPYFLNKTGQSKHKKSVGCFFHTYLGGPDPYMGRNMKEAHRDLKLTDEHFDKAVDYLRTILIDMKVDLHMIQEFMMQIEPLRSQITEKPTMSLFDRVKGKDGIKKAIEIYFQSVLKYKEVKQMFAKSDMPKVQEGYIEYLSLVFGGPSKYKGKQMKEAHSSLNIKENLFSMSVAQIQNAFNEAGVDKNSVNEIGRLLDCLRSEIPKRSDTLYQRIGGQAVIEMVCKQMYQERILKEDKIKDFFKGVDMKALELKMVDFFTMITGGPNKYMGKSAREAHKQYNIMSHQFDAYKNILQTTFLECGAVNESVVELMNLIDTIKIDVIGGKPPSLFEKIGGEDIIDYFSDKLFENIMEEKKIRHYFINVDLKSVKKHFKMFLAMATGGPSKYTGENVRDHHEQMDISDKDYTYFMDVVKKTINAEAGGKIKVEIAQEVITFFESMRGTIVSVED